MAKLSSCLLFLNVVAQTRIAPILPENDLIPSKQRAEGSSPSVCAILVLDRSSSLHTSAPNFLGDDQTIYGKG